jgi:H+/Cl- antiporter ClcA
LGGIGLSVVISLLKMAAVLLAASFLGNWFLSELKKARDLQKPWYVPYLTPPGLLMIIALFIPVVVWLCQR